MDLDFSKLLSFGGQMTKDQGFSMLREVILHPVQSSIKWEYNPDIF